MYETTYRITLKGACDALSWCVDCGRFFPLTFWLLSSTMRWRQQDSVKLKGNCTGWRWSGCRSLTVDSHDHTYIIRGGFVDTNLSVNMSHADAFGTPAKTSIIFRLQRCCQGKPKTISEFRVLLSGRAACLAWGGCGCRSYHHKPKLTSACCALEHILLFSLWSIKDAYE